MTLPAIILCIILSSLIGLLFHLWKDGGVGKLFYFLFLSWSGFWLGQILAIRFDISFGNVGQVYVGAGSLSSTILLIFGYWISLIEVKSK